MWCVWQVLVIKEERICRISDMFSWKSTLPLYGRIFWKYSKKKQIIHKKIFDQNKEKKYSLALTSCSGFIPRILKIGCSILSKIVCASVFEFLYESVKCVEINFPNKQLSGINTLKRQITKIKRSTTYTNLSGINIATNR